MCNVQEAACAIWRSCDCCGWYVQPVLLSVTGISKLRRWGFRFKPEERLRRSCRFQVFVLITVSNRTRPRALVQNQQVRESIKRSKESHRRNNKDPSPLQQLTPGMGVNTRYVNAQRPESPTVTPTWHASKYKLRKHTKI